MRPTHTRECIMKKLVLDGLGILMAIMLCSGIISCNNEEDSDEYNAPSSHISGLWSASNGSYKGVSFLIVYNFINSNTVIDYSTVSNSTRGWAAEIESIPGHSGWYYAPLSMKNYTYYILNNKIYITNGKIFTITDSGLLEDGSNKIYTKW